VGHSLASSWVSFQSEKCILLFPLTTVWFRYLSASQITYDCSSISGREGNESTKHHRTLALSFLLSQQFTQDKVGREVGEGEGVIKRCYTFLFFPGKTIPVFLISQN